MSAAINYNYNRLAIHLISGGVAQTVPQASTRSPRLLCIHIDPFSFDLFGHSRPPSWSSISRLISSIIRRSPTVVTIKERGDCYTSIAGIKHLPHPRHALALMSLMFSCNAVQFKLNHAPLNYFDKSTSPPLKYQCNMHMSTPPLTI